MDEVHQTGVDIEAARLRISQSVVQETAIEGVRYVLDLESVEPIEAVVFDLHVCDLVDGQPIGFRILHRIVPNVCVCGIHLDGTRLYAFHTAIGNNKGC